MALTRTNTGEIIEIYGSEIGFGAVRRYPIEIKFSRQSEKECQTTRVESDSVHVEPEPLPLQPSVAVALWNLI